MLQGMILKYFMADQVPVRKITPSDVREQNLSPLLETDFDVQSIMEIGRAHV